MAYQRQTFTDNKTVLKAEHLEHIEDGIVAIEEALVGGALESLAIQAGRGITINGETSGGSSGGNQEEDIFKVSNGKLKYPIALITVDEVVYAGAILQVVNNNFFLHSGKTY